MRNDIAYIPGEVIVVKNGAGGPMEFHYRDVEKDNYPAHFKIETMSFEDAMACADDWGLTKMEFLLNLIWSLVHVTNEAGKVVDGGEVVTIERAVCDVLDAADSNAIVDYVEFGTPTQDWYLSVLFPAQEAFVEKVLVIWSCINGHYSEKTM